MLDISKPSSEDTNKSIEVLASWKKQRLLS